MGRLVRTRCACAAPRFIYLSSASADPLPAPAPLAVLKGTHRAEALWHGGRHDAKVASEDAAISDGPGGMGLDEDGPFRVDVDMPSEIYSCRSSVDDNSSRSSCVTPGKGAIAVPPPPNLPSLAGRTERSNPLGRLSARLGRISTTKHLQSSHV